MNIYQLCNRRTLFCKWKKRKLSTLKWRLDFFVHQEYVVLIIKRKWSVQMSSCSAGSPQSLGFSDFIPQAWWEISTKSMHWCPRKWGSLLIMDCQTHRQNMARKKKDKHLANVPRIYREKKKEWLFAQLSCSSADTVLTSRQFQNLIRFLKLQAFRRRVQKTENVLDKWV